MEKDRDIFPTIKDLLEISGTGKGFPMEIASSHLAGILLEISSMDIRYMERAIALARSGMQGREGGPFGAVVVRGGEIIGEGWNRVLATNDPTAHGEVVAIRDACAKTKTFSLEGCEIYTTGQPCPMCLGAIHWARIGTVYYGFTIADAAAIGFDDTEFFRQFALPPESRAIPEMELGRELALQLAVEYAELPDRALY